MMDIRFAIFPGNTKLFVRYCETCGKFLGGIKTNRKPWDPGCPTNTQKAILSELQCPICHQIPHEEVGNELRGL